MTSATGDLVIERRRLARAVHLDVSKGVGPGTRFQVTGGSQQREVAHEEEGKRCNCPDHVVRGQLCKHLLAVELHEGNQAVVRALRRLVPCP